jgi:hypothetical protein
VVLKAPVSWLLAGGPKCIGEITCFSTSRKHIPSVCLLLLPVRTFVSPLRCTTGKYDGLEEPAHPPAAHLPGGDFRVCGGLEQSPAMGLLYGFLA